MLIIIEENMDYIMLAIHFYLQRILPLLFEISLAALFSNPYFYATRFAGVISGLKFFNSIMLRNLIWIFIEYECIKDMLKWGLCGYYFPLLQK